jgi:hypothetical protein
MLEEVIMMRRHLSSIARIGFVLLLWCASPAFAQLGGTITAPVISTNFRFDVPLSLAVAHPCYAGFVLINGTTTLNLTTVKGTDFRVQLTATATGTGEDASAAGIRLANGSLPYDYASESELLAKFPDGTPAMFAHSLTLVGELIRTDEDAFTITTTFDLAYTNGIPTAPTLKSIDISCN